MSKLADRPLPEQATFLGVIIGMAKDGGYSLAQFKRVVTLAWPHVPNEIERTRQSGREP